MSNAVAEVRARIDAAARRAGRDPSDVLLLGATKTVDPQEILEAVRAGLTCAGENRVQELIEKQEALAGEPDARDLRWDLIGTLQRNKINKVVGRVGLIHSIDSVDLARAAGRRAEALGVAQDVLLEVNTSGEPTKHGFEPDDAGPAVAKIAAIAGVRLRGLMTLAAPGDPDASRACFRMLSGIRESHGVQVGATELSMGMSDDFEVAVEEGATIVRVGTLLFVARCDLGLGA
jgi:pyridoxal phosphate enzyme (YggS family)